MDLICPECRAFLEVVDAQNATCAGHDGRYQILFDRRIGVVEEPASKPGPTPAPVQAMPAAVAEDPNVKSCPDCGAANPLSAARCGACRADFPLLSLSFTPRAAPSYDNVFCAQHPEVQAVTRCRICSSGVCATCDFLLPGNVHVCPACLEKEPPTGLSSKRKVLMVLSIPIAAYGTFMYALVMSGALRRTIPDTQTLGLLMTYGILFPSVLGMSLALVASDRRRGNNAGIWIGIVWNSLNVAFFFLLTIIGLMKK